MNKLLFNNIILLSFFCFVLCNSRPLSPVVYSQADSGKVILNWDGALSLSSPDTLSGYYDFEGFRIYRSEDGGINWGGADDRVYFNGAFVGWTPYVQFDLSLANDTTFCVVESPANCDSTMLLRDLDISGLDPLAPWVNLGLNTGVEYSFVDTNVYNGKEYTYAVVSYDMGVRSYIDEYIPLNPEIGWCYSHIAGSDPTQTLYQECCNSNCGTWSENESFGWCDFSNYNSVDSDGDDEFDCQGANIPDWDMIYEHKITWPASNPDSLQSAEGVGYPSMESIDLSILSESIELGLVSIEDFDNVVMAVPGFYAENIDNISFDELEEAEGILMTPDSHTIGNGDRYFSIINEGDLTDNVYQFEIRASQTLESDGSEGEVFEGYHTENPTLFVYQVISTTDLTPTETMVENAPTSYDEARALNIKYGLNLGEKCLVNLAWLGNPNQYDECLLEVEPAMLDLPAATLIASGEYELPNYEVLNFPVKYLDDPTYSTNFTDFFDGIRYRFDNTLGRYGDGIAAVKRITFISAAGDTTVLGDYVPGSGRDILSLDDYGIELIFGNEGDSFDKKASYSYKITFSDAPIYEVLQTDDFCPTGFCSDPNYFKENNCLGAAAGNLWTPFEDIRTKSKIPFEITNLTTGKKVGVWHVDKGSNYGNDIGSCEACTGVNEWCDNGQCKKLIGYGDCTWERNERLAFKGDTVSVSSGDNDAYYTFDMRLTSLDYALEVNYVPTYVADSTYNVNQFVNHNNMIYEAQAPIATHVVPSHFIDDNDDGVNDNPWKINYWFNAGDQLLIEPIRWYVDGDSWIVDVGKLGIENEIVQSDLDKVQVVPNPYFVHSDFNETLESGRMWFTHLPNRCKISIYTVSGQLVKSFDHSDEFGGQIDWDLKTGNGDVIAPGLYLYVVQAGGADNQLFKHIGKFYVVR